MQDSTKKKLMFIGSIVVAVMFLTSYAAISNNISNVSTTTTKQVALVPYPFFGSANATVTSYSSAANITVPNATVSSEVYNALQALESSNKITDYINTTGGYSIFLGTNFTPYQLQKSIANISGAKVQSLTYVKLPEIIKMSYSNGPVVDVLAKNLTYPVQISPIPESNSIIPVRVDAIVNQNYQIYNADISYV